MRTVIAIAVVIVLSGCENYRESTFIVPDGFRGRLVLVAIEELPPAYKIENNRNVYRFPESGVLCVGKGNRSVAKTWDRNIARYESGAAIPIVSRKSDPEEKFDDVRFRILGGTGIGYAREKNQGLMYDVRHGEFWAAVGSYSDMVEASKGMFGGSPRHAVKYCMQKDP